MSAPALEQTPVKAPVVETIDLRPALWFAANSAGSGLATAALLLVGVAYGVDPAGFALGLALLLAAVALLTGWNAWDHRQAFLDQIDRV